MLFTRLFSYALTGSMVLSAGYIPGRYIVELSTEPVAEHVAGIAALQTQKPSVRMSSSAALSHRTRIQSEQQTLRSRFENRNITVLDSVNTVANAVFVQASDADAAQLASMPGVKRVRRVRTAHMLLDQAVLLHKVDQVWNQVGFDRAGAGVKIGILDSGIDIGHPAFSASSLSIPNGFPRANNTANLAYTNSKVIVARSYVNLLGSRDPDRSPRDHVGHGTALGMIAAGMRNKGPLATITGVAPEAWLGNYKIFGTPGYNDSTSDDAILKAIDDAVADGMDIISLSFGTDVASRLEEDPEVDAIQRATKAGVIVIASAGNNGTNLNTVASPATAPSAIAVGASTNNRTFAGRVTLPGFTPIVALPGDGQASSASVTGTIADVSRLDTDGLGCSAFPSGALAGQVALILRGDCTFEAKLNNAQQAGAIGALVYAAQGPPIHMGVGKATLPAEMISFDDGTAVRNAVTADSSLKATLDFTLALFPVTPKLLTDFSAAGPNVDLSIKPDLVATGQDMYVATQSYDQDGDMYSPDGYILVNGTSFSAPFVAGVAALLKSARPGLTVDQYRSLLINGAGKMYSPKGQPLGVQQVGTGLLDALNSLRSTVTASPVSLSFGAGGSTVDAKRTLTITNVSTATESFSVNTESNGCSTAPVSMTSTVAIAAGKSADIPVSWTASSMSAGPCEGAFVITGASSGSQVRVPWWYAVTSDVPAQITVLDSLTSARRNSVQTDAVLFRITDSAGVPILNPPEVKTISGGVEVRAVNSYDSDSPGLFSVDLRMGPVAGDNLIEIDAGELSVRVKIAGQ